MINIIKYKNRKLYLKSLKKFIDQNQLIKLIKEGNEVEIIDFETKEDVTQKVLSSSISKMDISSQSLKYIIRNN